MATIAVIWCPLKKGITGIELADASAKAAISLPQVIDVTPNPTAVLKKIKAQLLRAATAPPPQPILDRLMGFYDPEATFKALSKLPRADATAVAQIRAGHCPMNAYLFRFKAADPPNCDLCKQSEDVCHLLTTCKKFVGLRRNLYNAARKLKTRTSRAHLVTNPKLFGALSDYVRRSHRFYKARHKRFVKTPTANPQQPRA